MDSRQFTRIYIYPTLEKLIQQFNQFSICDYYFQNYFVTTNMKQNTYWNEKKCQIRTIFSWSHLKNFHRNTFNSAGLWNRVNDLSVNWTGFCSEIVKLSALITVPVTPLRPVTFISWRNKLSGQEERGNFKFYDTGMEDLLHYLSRLTR